MTAQSDLFERLIEEASQETERRLCGRYVTRPGDALGACPGSGEIVNVALNGHVHCPVCGADCGIEISTDATVAEHAPAGSAS